MPASSCGSLNRAGRSCWEGWAGRQALEVAVRCAPCSIRGRGPDHPAWSPDTWHWVRLQGADPGELGPLPAEEPSPHPRPCRPRTAAASQGPLSGVCAQARQPRSVAWTEGILSPGGAAQNPTRCPEVRAALPRPQVLAASLEDASWFTLA